MMRRMRTSKTGLELIKSFEGFRSRAVQLPDGRWTIGYAHTKTARENLRITPADAESVLREYELPPVELAVSSAVLAPLNQNEFDALVSFVFNIGESAFLSSKTLTYLNSGQPLSAVDAMSNWRKASVNGRLIVVDALVRRRVMEQALFLKHPSGTVSAPSGFIHPVGEPIEATATKPIPSAAERPAPKPTAKPTKKAAVAEIAPAKETSRLMRELGKPSQAQSPKPTTKASELPSGPTADEITRAISALTNPDGGLAADLVKGEAASEKSLPEAVIAGVDDLPAFEIGTDDLPPLPEIRSREEVDIPNLETSTPALKIIDDLEPVELDLDMLEKAAADANSKQSTGIAFKVTRRAVYWTSGVAGFLLGALSLYRLRGAFRTPALRDDPLDIYLNIGGVTLGAFLIMVALVLAFRAKTSKN